MANTILFTLGRELDANGVTVGGAKAYFYEAGTTTPLTVYSDTDASIAHASPVVADAGGLFPACYTTASSAKAVITKADDSALRTIDPCPVLSLSGVGASGVSFNPTVDIPETNVQDAIETAAATAASGFTPYGLGVAGNTDSLADKDATTIPSGGYRTESGTSGTYPSGFVAADGGVLRTWRRSASSAIEEFMPATADRRFFRRLATTWQAFREYVTVTGGASRGALVRMGASNWERFALGTSGQVLRSDGTDAVWGNISQTFYTSADTNIPSSGSSTSFTHSLGGVPKIVIVQFVCATAEEGFSIGDVIPAHAYGRPSDPEYNIGWRANATTINCTLAANGTTAVRQSDGEVINITRTSWRLRVIAIA